LGIKRHVRWHDVPRQRRRLDGFFGIRGEVGLSFPLNERLELVPAVRYVWIDNSGGGQEDDTAWLFKAGLRYKF
jgi:hypothetical protein